MKKVLIPLQGDDIAPRFDCAQEVLVAIADEHGQTIEQRVVVLAQASPEHLCDLIIREKADVVVCCGIEDEFYQFLRWKGVTVFDSVIGPVPVILEQVLAGKVSGGDILF